MDVQAQTDNVNGDVPRADVAIVGAGPIGLELAVALKQAGVDYLQFDAKQIGYTISWWPRDTHFFSTTERLAIAGVPIQNNHQQRITGEEYLAYLRGIVEQFDLSINTYEPVERIERIEDGFLLQTRKPTGEKQYLCRRLVLATGDMDFPNRLGIQGEELPHVSHYFKDPHDYFRKRLLIVGGKNSAVEAALRCWRAGAQVTISYRRAEFDSRRVKGWLLPDLRTQIDLGTIDFLPQTVPLAITPSHVLLAPTQNGQPIEGERIEQPADFVLLATGFEADMTLFQAAGVDLQSEEQVPAYDPETMETNVSGLYVAGTAAAGTQTRYTLFIENCHEHVGKIVAHLTGSWPRKLGTIDARNYEVPLAHIEAN